MALIKCKECGNEVSSKAKTCPKCGASIQKHIGCLGSFVVIIIVIIIIAVFSSGPSDKSGGKNGASHARSKGGGTGTQVNDKSKKISKEGDTVHVGYTSYAVWRSWWADRLSNNRYLNQPPNASYLFIEISIRNDDKKPRMVPPLTLLDQEGREYEASTRGYAIEGSIGVLETLNPDVSKQGIIVFDVPKDRSYRLKLSGGYWSLEDAFVKITPKDHK